MSTLRKKYLEDVLKQDVGFFDTDARTGDVVFSISTDTLLVQDAISEKVIPFSLFLSKMEKNLMVSSVGAKWVNSFCKIPIWVVAISLIRATCAR